MDADDIERALDVDDRYQHWVYRHPVQGAALGGFIATQITTIWGYYAVGIGLPGLPWPNFNGGLFAPGSFAADFSNYGNAGQFFVGQSIHMVNGVVFAILFALMLYPKLPTFMPKMPSLQKGLLFGVVLAIISAGFLVPYVYVPKQGYGFFSFGTDDGAKLPLAILIWHLVYGGLLGLLYDPKRPDNAST
jgi:hypothetical protein